VKKEKVGDMGMKGSSGVGDDNGFMKVLVVFLVMFLLGAGYVLADVAVTALNSKAEKNARIARVVRMYERNGGQISPEVMRRIEQIQPRSFSMAAAGADAPSSGESVQMDKEKVSSRPLE
jgi:hypothetical protein